jgi:hypothetical protein
MGKDTAYYHQLKENYSSYMNNGVDYDANNIINTIDEPFTMTTGLIHQRNIIVVNVYDQCNLLL